MSRTFIDTNIWVYAADNRYEQKRRIAGEWIARLIHAKSAVVSMQVIVEFARADLEKLHAPPHEVQHALGAFDAVDVVPYDIETVRRAIELRQLHQVAFWDGLILAAAERAGCATLLSEDLNPGQSYSGVKVENPFAA